MINNPSFITMFNSERRLRVLAVRRHLAVCPGTKQEPGGWRENQRHAGNFTEAVRHALHKLVTVYLVSCNTFRRYIISLEFGHT